MNNSRKPDGRWETNKRLRVHHHAAFDDDPIEVEEFDAETQQLIEESAHKWPSRRPKKRSTSRS